MRQVGDHCSGMTIIVIISQLIALGLPKVFIAIIFSWISPFLAWVALKGYISSRSS